ncbi:MAG: hypothetical protein V1774_03995 [Candidatus Eisenbacteria bacterium]
MQRIALIGSRDLAGRLIHYIEMSGCAAIAGLFDDFEQRGATKLGKPVLGSLAAIPEIYGEGRFDAVLVAIGYRHMTMRGKVYEDLRAAGIPRATFIHPHATIDPTAHIGSGSIVLAECRIDMHARLEENVLLSTRCLISHDVTIASHTFCGPAVVLAGRTAVGESCFLGVGTIAIEDITIGAGAQSAAGAVIISDVPAGALVAGVPAVVKRAVRS